MLAEAAVRVGLLDQRTKRQAPSRLLLREVIENSRMRKS